MCLLSENHVIHTAFPIKLEMSVSITKTWKHLIFLLCYLQYGLFGLLEIFGMAEIKLVPVSISIYAQTAYLRSPSTAESGQRLVSKFFLHQEAHKAATLYVPLDRGTYMYFILPYQNSV